MKYESFKGCTIGRFEVGLGREYYNKYYYKYHLEFFASDDSSIYRSWWFEERELGKAIEEYERIVQVCELITGCEAIHD